MTITLNVDGFAFPSDQLIDIVFLFKSKVSIDIWQLRITHHYKLFCIHRNSKSNSLYPKVHASGYECDEGMFTPIKVLSGGRSVTVQLGEDG